MSRLVGELDSDLASHTLASAGSTAFSTHPSRPRRCRQGYRGLRRLAGACKHQTPTPVEKWGDFGTRHGAPIVLAFASPSRGAASYGALPSERPGELSRGHRSRRSPDRRQSSRVRTGPLRVGGSIGRPPLCPTIGRLPARPRRLAAPWFAARSQSIGRGGRLPRGTRHPRAIPPRDRPGRNRDRGLRRGGTRVRPHQRTAHGCGLPRRSGALARGSHHDQHSSRALQPAVALRQRSRARAHRDGCDGWLRRDHGRLLRDRHPREWHMGRRVPALVLADRAPPQPGHPGRRPVRHPGRGRRRALAGPRDNRRPPGNSALRRRQRRRAHRPLRPEAPRFGRPAGGVPRRRPGPDRRDRRRASRSSEAWRRWSGPLPQREPRPFSSRCPARPGTWFAASSRLHLALHLEVRTVPPVTDLLDGSVDAYRVRRVHVEDLLRRPMVTDHAAGVEEIIRDRTVVITGGGGSIGSELARQVFAIGPRRLDPRGSSGEPALPGPTRAGDPADPRPGKRRAGDPPRERGKPRDDGAPDRRPRPPA